MCHIIEKVVNPLLYLLSNIAIAFTIAIMLLVGSLIQRKTIKNIKSNVITVIAVLICLSIVLTRIVSVPFQFGPTLKVRVDLGKFLIFVIAMIYGPFFGVLSAICADVLGTILNLSGVYHIGFMFNSVIYGFFGSMVFAFKTNKWWQVKAIGFYLILFILESFALTPAWLYFSATPKAIIFADYISRLIKAPVVIIYILVMLSSFKVIYQIILTKTYINLWVLRNGRISFNYKKDKIYRRKSKLIS